MTSCPEWVYQPCLQLASIPTRKEPAGLVCKDEMRRDGCTLIPVSSLGEMGPHLAQCGLDRGPPPCQVPSWLHDPWPADLLSSLNPTFSVKTLHVWRCFMRTNEPCGVGYPGDAYHAFMLISGVARYGALGHVRALLDVQHFNIFQLTLELHKVWQRLCAVASPNILGLRASGNLPVSYGLTGNLPVTYHQ